MKVSKGGRKGGPGRGVLNTPFATHGSGPGKVAGAGIVKTGEPGSFPRGVKSTMGNAMSSGPASGKVPRGMRTYSEE